MRIAIINLTSGGLSGGYKKYLENIIPILSFQNHILNMYFPPNSTITNLTHLNNKFWPKYDYITGYRWLKKDVQEFNPDIIFIPTARYLNFRFTPTIIMLHNMEPLIMPFSFSIFSSLKNIIRYLLARNACKKATGIIAVSNFVKDFLMAQWEIPCDKINVIYHGIDYDESMNMNI